MSTPNRQQHSFSDQLEAWLKGDQPKSLQGLIDVFAEKSFAIILLLLLALPALPIPTGGITHIFEIIAMLISLEMVAGRHDVWLPARWQKVELSPAMQKGILKSLVRIVRRLERFSRPRLSPLMRNINFIRLIGLVCLVFTLFAFLAPPFSGLDTLPALGIVLIALSLILEDFLLLVLGFITGAIGVALVLVLGKAVFKLL